MNGKFYTIFRILTEGYSRKKQR